MFLEDGTYCKNLNKISGQNNNSLDVIMARKPIEWVKAEVERIGARGGRAFTVTFTDSYLNKYKESYLEREVNQVIKKTRGVIEHIMVSEYSDAGRFHLHGVVLCKDLKGLGLVRRKMSTYGICKVKPIDNSPKWAEYCTKQRNKSVNINPSKEEAGRESLSPSVRDSLPTQI